MGLLLAVVGIIWAVIGAANIFGMPWMDPDLNGIVTFGLIFNMVLFVIPGLLLAGLGFRIGRKKEAEAEAKETPEKRISKLNGMLAAGFINQTEYEERRSKILNDI